MPLNPAPDWSTSPNPLRVAVLGAGYVGLVTAIGLVAIGHEVDLVERSPERARRVSRGQPDFFEPQLAELTKEGVRSGRLRVHERLPSDLHWEIAMVAVGTGTTNHQSADLSAAEEAVASLAQQRRRLEAVVIRSTVPPGFARRMASEYGDLPVGSNPEFLQEGRALKQFLDPDRIVLGADHPRVRELLRTLYEPLPGPRFECDTATAELSKLAANSFLAVRVSLINEIGDMAAATGVNIDDVAQAIGLDPRIGPHYLRAGLGFGGSCLPKDLDLLREFARSLSVQPRLLDAAHAVNSNRVDALIERALHAGLRLRGTRVAVLGMAFKPGTDDTRNSPGINLARALVDAGADVVAHDVLVSAEQLDVPVVALARTPLEAARGAAAVFVALDAPEYAALELGEFARVMSGNLVIDGRGVIDPVAAAAAGLRYVGLGRSSVAPGGAYPPVALSGTDGS